MLDRALFTLFVALVQRFWQPPLDAGRIRQYAGPKRV